MRNNQHDELYEIKWQLITLNETLKAFLTLKESEERKEPSSPVPLIREKQEAKETSPSNAGARARAFVAPTVEEIAAYAKENGITIDAQAFWDFYDSKDWMIGKNKMKKWRSAVSTWVRREKKRFTADDARKPTSFLKANEEFGKEFLNGLA